MNPEQQAEAILNLEMAPDAEEETQNTEAILNLEQAVEQFSQEVRPLLDPTSEENWNGEKLRARELAILQAGLRLVGHCIAILIYQLALNASVQLAANLAATGLAGLSYTSQGMRPVTITLMVPLKSLFRRSTN